MDKPDDNNVGLTTVEALDRLHKDIEQVLIQHEKTQISKRTKLCLKDAFHHSSYYTPLCWTSLLSIITYLILLFIAYLTTEKKSTSLIYEFVVVALILAVNVCLVFTETKLRHEEIPRRVKIILQEIQRAVGNEKWGKGNYPHLCSPYSPCITLQWTYRDGELVNLPWALLVKGDVVLIRPGQVSPGYCEAIDKTEEYPLLHPKEVYGPSLKNANESISVPKARRPLLNRRYRLLETPYLSNLHLALEQATVRPPTRLDNRRRLIVTRCVEQCAMPLCVMLAVLIGFARRVYLGNVFGGGDAVDIYVLIPAGVALPLLPVVFPVAWFMLNHIGNAKLRALFDHSSISQSSFSSPFDEGDTTSLPLPTFTFRDLWNNFILVACGTGHIMTRTSNMLHVLGSVTALCCVDKKGILSWPNPTAEKVFFLHNAEEEDSKDSSLENVGDITEEESMVEKKEEKLVNIGLPCNTIPNTIRYNVDHPPMCTVAEVLDLTHDHKDPFKLHFDDQEWSRHISSLKPLGLAILLNTCNLDTQEHYSQFCSHVTCEAMYNENLIPVTNRRCLCELAKQIGFSEHAQKIFKLEQQLSTFRHLQPEMMRRDNKFARSLQLSTKLKFPFPHMVAVVVKELSSGAHQLLSQGTADIVLDSCVDYWDGNDLCFLTPSDRKKALDFYQRTSLTAYCTAFAYRPLNGNVSDKLSQVFLELPSDSKQLYRTRRSPTPIHWDCKNLFEPKFKGPLAQFFSTDSLLFNDSASTDASNTDNCFDVQCNQIFIGMVTMQYQAQIDMVHLIEQLERACIRFVHFSKENELRSRVFSEKMGLESGWNCHISLLSERTRRESGPSECWANNGTARVCSPSSLPQRKRSPAVSPGSVTTPNNVHSNLEQSKAISFSAPSAINLEHATVKFDPEVEHPASCGDSGEGCDLATSEDSMLMGDQANSTSPAHEHWQSLSCLTDSTEQSAPVHFDMSNRAKLPRGIDKIRPHIEQIDNVPLLVSLFTDCTPSVIREMLHIMQDFGEVVCVVTSSANADHMGICLQADAALAVEPLYPQVCQIEPPYLHSETSPSPVELSRALNALSCVLSARREDPLAVFPLVMHARHYTKALWSCIQFWLGCSATITLTQLVAVLVMLPPILKTGHVLWLITVIVPLLSISLTFVPTDPAIMRTPLGKESFKINTSALTFVFWCYGAKFIPVVVSSVLTYGAALTTYCAQICAPENLNCTCAFYYLPHLEEGNKWGGWTYHSYTWLAAQHAAILVIVVHFIIISISFVNRSHSIWRKGPHNNLIWICTVAIIIVLHTIFTATNLAVEQTENQLGFGDLSYLILIFICVSIFLTFAITEFIKWKEIKVNLRYQRRARLDFGTKLDRSSISLTKLATSVGLSLCVAQNPWLSNWS